MAPVKFDDLAKTATDVVNSDYQGAGYQLKAKQKTSWNGAVLDSAFDLWPSDGGIQTPAKLGLKMPKAFGVSGLNVDKLEMDKGGKFKLESSASCCLHGVKDLKVEVKSDLAGISKATAGITYTGLANAQLKLDVPMSFQKFTAEATVAVDKATVGVKLNESNLTAPDVGLRYEAGPLFAALLAKESFGTFSAHLAYKANSDVKVGAAYQHGGKGSGACSLGLIYTGMQDMVVKAKVQQDQSVSAYVKKNLAKGFSVAKTFKYETASGKSSFGLTLSVE
eukprot:TRINITY_DN109282_c0_g1_i1.p1 TRINITY_DN109282_c0_g1~~TRINITY_DN109282_c0_g1_i1.p1  ORF type:complete len:279 (+),score=78.09 TRINITY_DN109282_c0_g1_i1:86-922(+)